jgi:hypothetical protein
LSFGWVVYCRTSPGRTEEEWHCREAVALLRAYLYCTPTEGTEALNRLEAQLADYLAEEKIGHAPVPCP